MTHVRAGDPSNPDTQIGPLVFHCQQQRVRDYIQVGQREGARLVVGGTEEDGSGVVLRRRGP
jgi:acyl-CoA reductase-like NAD-dependent aldehyde dehydrogenase